MIVALWPLAVVISIAVAVLQYHLYDVRLVIRRVVVYGGLTIALTALFVGVYFAVLAALSGQVVAVRYRWVAIGSGYGRRLGRRAGAEAHPDPTGAPVPWRTGRPIRGAGPTPCGPVERGRGRENCVRHDHSHGGCGGPLALGSSRPASRAAGRDRVGQGCGARRRRWCCRWFTAASGWARCASAHALQVNRTAGSTGRCSTSWQTRPPPWCTRCVATPSWSRHADERWRPWPRSVLG